MNANDVKNEFEKELAQLQLNGMMRLQDQDKKYQDELKYEQKRAEIKWKHETELKKLEEEKEKEERLLREKNMKLLKESSQESQKLDKKEGNQLQEMLNQGMALRSNIERREERKSSGNVILETRNKWNSVKEIYDLVKMVYFMRNSNEGFTVDEITDILEHIKRLMNKKEELDNHLMVVKDNHLMVVTKRVYSAWVPSTPLTGVLGKWKQTASKEQFEKVQCNLELLSTTNIEEMVSNLRRTLKLNKSTDRNLLLKMDETINNYDISVDNFIQNQTGLMLSSNAIDY
ncbi:hypothetical protein GCK72_013906 [Caenorhabditis remanei]|uniref:Uncharacterized protein n=1 Tax=Caenorhabditis remanei TaxID=31234 RepID=A0A6A5GPX8_CAERE|nr:hypothetical protein GCK72_013906 [Caenorhabditis remanei]KAF1757450.1 hypothetical protein GCK72_013906 [Caenorhabditis remanei]